MHRNFFVPFVMAVVIIIPMAVRASDGTITFTGSLNGSTCTIASSASFTVALPSLSTASLSHGAGAVSGNTPFSLSLSACNAGITGATMYFEAGPNIDTATGRLKIASGGAANVQLQILNQDGTVIDLSKPTTAQNTTQATVSSSAAVLQYTAQYYATGTVGPGNVSSTVTYSIAYN